MQFLFKGFIPNHHRLAEKEQVNVVDIQEEAFIMPKLGCTVSIKKFLNEQGISPNIQFNAEE